MGQVLEPNLTVSVSLLATLGSGTYGLLLQVEAARTLMKPGSDGGQAPLREGGPVLAVALSPRKQAAQCPTCCAQHARREWREDCAGSGDADEDEGAEALAGFFCLVEMWGVFCGRIAREAS